MTWRERAQEQEEGKEKAEDFDAPVERVGGFHIEKKEPVELRPKKHRVMPHGQIDE
jgi:hypothetical protein